jgi:hypothetical protein
MHVALTRLVRLGLPAVAVLSLGLAACIDPAVPVPSAPSTSTPSGSALQTSGTPEVTGLTVRYLDDDGTLRTVQVKDFQSSSR